MDKICPQEGGIPGDEFSFTPALAPSYTDIRLVKFDRPVRPVRAEVVLAQAVNLTFLQKEDGCELFTENEVLIIV